MTGYVNTLIISHHRCNNLTSCLYVPCFSMANMLTSSNIFLNLAKESLFGHAKPPIFLTSLQKHQSWENLSCKPTPFCSLKRHECVFVETLQRKCHRIGEFKSTYLKTSLPATWKASKVQKCQPTWWNIGKTEGMLSKTWEVNSSAEILRNPLDSYDIYFGHEKTCCCDIILFLMECFAHCMPSAQVIQEDLLYRTCTTSKTSTTVYCSTWTCSSMSISPTQTEWR